MAIVSTATKRILFLGFLALSLAACQSGGDDRASVSGEIPIKMNAARYASEPYHVDVLNRSVFAAKLQPVIVQNTTGLPAGTILVDTSAKQLSYVQSDDTVRRYGIAVGASGHAWKGQATIQRKATWPAWYPTDEMKKAAPGIPSRIPSGADNPLGARALYLYQNGHDTLFRIHGTPEPMGLGTEVSSGCIRMLNEDVIDLYDHVPVGTRVVVR